MWILIYQYYQKYMICITLIDTFCISNIFQANKHNMLYFKEQKSQLVLKSFRATPHKVHKLEIKHD